MERGVGEMRRGGARSGGLDLMCRHGWPGNLPLDAPARQVCWNADPDADSAGRRTDRIVGLEWAPTNYVTKPFSVREVVARVRALLRRREPIPQPPCCNGATF